MVDAENPGEGCQVDESAADRERGPDNPVSAAEAAAERGRFTNAARGKIVTSPRAESGWRSARDRVLNGPSAVTGEQVVAQAAAESAMLVAVANGNLSAARGDLEAFERKFADVLARHRELRERVEIAHHAAGIADTAYDRLLDCQRAVAGPGISAAVKPRG